MNQRRNFSGEWSTWKPCRQLPNDVVCLCRTRESRIVDADHRIDIEVGSCIDPTHDGLIANRTAFTRVTDSVDTKGNCLDKQRLKFKEQSNGSAYWDMKSEKMAVLKR